MSPNVQTESGRQLAAERLASAWFEHDQAGVAAYIDGPDRLEPLETRILYLICELRRCPISQIRSHVSVHSVTASRAVSRLVDAGLAERRRYFPDRRLVFVEPSEAGDARYRGARTRCAELMKSATAGLEPDDALALAANIELFTDLATKFLTDYRNQ